LGAGVSVSGIATLEPRGLWDSWSGTERSVYCFGSCHREGLEQALVKKHLDWSMSIRKAFCPTIFAARLFVFARIFFLLSPFPLDAQLVVGEKGHEAEVHVELLVAVEESQTRVLGEEVDLDFLVSAHHHYIFMYS
jgi:hypothetical protein